jgi:nucleoside-diphosphate-sugar epimerase
MPWRPLVHIEDISRAFVALLHAPREVVHDEAFNVGQTSENYRVREVAAIVEEVVPGSKVTYSNEAAPDIRNYRVSCDKIASLVPEYQPQWTVRRGVEQLYDAFLRNGLAFEDFLSRRFLRIKHVKQLQEEGVLDEGLRRLDLEPTLV